MGGAVSSGESNDELVDNLMNADYIKSPQVESVFRAVDRGFYFTKEHRSSAYKDLAWKDGNLHISAPCIYTEVMENLRVKPGMSFLNIGSGTGYFSTIVGLLLGKSGINHGIELHEDVVEYARAKLAAFLHSSPAIDLFDFAPPEFIVGNICEVLPGSCQRYDRIYCGAACTSDEAKLIVNLLKVGGVCIIPLNDSLLQITRSSAGGVETKTLLSVSFASLVPSSSDEMSKKPSTLPGWNAKGLKELCRAEIRDIIRKTIPKPPTPSASESRKRKVIRRRKQRRTNRLLLVQRRRRDFQVSPMVETSSEDEESGRCRSPSAVSSIPNPANVSTSSKGQVDPEVGHDSGTESAEPQSMPYQDTKEKCSGGVPVITVATSISTQKSEATCCCKTSESDNVPEAGTSQSKPSEVQPEAGSSGTENPGTSRPVNADDQNDSDGDGSPGTSFVATGRRCPKTARILERIREIIRRRQQNRAARHDATAEGDPNLRADFEAIEAAIEEPEAIAQQREEEGMEFDCLWSTTDEDSSSSSSDWEPTNQLMIVGNGQNLEGEEQHEMEIGALGHDIVPVRRIRRINVDSSDDDDDYMGAAQLPQFVLPPNTAPLIPPGGQTNIEIEIGALEEEMRVNVPMTNVVSLQLKSKINLLPLPPPVKHFLNFGRI